MFEECNTLSELNVARTKASLSGENTVQVNNAYNKRRQEILAVRKPYVVLKPIHPIHKDVVKYCGVPVVGRSTNPGCIKLTPKGFLY